MFLLTNKIPIQILLTMGIWITTAGCNSIFYQPDTHEFTTPKKVDVAFDRHFIDSTDGIKIHLWHMKPDQKTAQKGPKGVVVQFHGNGENMSTHFLSVVWLTAVGYHVIAFDYRGYGKSDPTPPSREGCVSDGRAVFDWIAKQPVLQNLPLFVIGQSLGAAVAIPTIASHTPKHLRGIVLDSAFSSYRAIARDKLSSVWLTWPLQWPLGFLVTDDLSPIDSIKQVSVPILSVHAPTDPIVSYQLGRELFEASSSQDKIFWDIHFGGHIAAFAIEESKYRDRLLEWMENKL